MNIQDTVEIIIKKAIQTDATIQLSDNIFTDHEADSLDHIEIIMALESEYKIEITDAQAEVARTLKDYREIVIDQLALDETTS